MNGITTHVLDTAAGRPAAGIDVSLQHRVADGTFREVGAGTTDDDGRVADFFDGRGGDGGEYRLVFETGAYFQSHGVDAFHPRVEITFTVRDASEHHHVPVLLAPFGYTTYRGS